MVVSWWWFNVVWVDSVPLCWTVFKQDMEGQRCPVALIAILTKIINTENIVNISINIVNEFIHT